MFAPLRRSAPAPTAVPILLVCILAAALLAFPAARPAAAAAPAGDGASSPLITDELDPEETAPAGGPVATAARSKLQRASLKKLLGARTDDLWTVADAMAMMVDPRWDNRQGAYHRGPAIRTRANAEMLIAHSLAALSGHKGAVNQPQRIAPLVQLLTGRAYVGHGTTGRGGACPRGGAECWHVPGFVDIGTRRTMHRSRDAVVMRALAAAWQARKQAKLSLALTNRLRRVVSATARSTFWRTPSRLQNQVNWTADVMAAYQTVTGSGTLIRREYHRQWAWFLTHARRPAYGGGTSNLSPGLGFHYVATRPDSYLMNGADTVEYANIVFSGLKYYDAARRSGMARLSTGEATMLWRWTRHLLDGNWTTSGYLNWDTGHGLGRIHLTQYWLLSLRGIAMGLAGTQREHLFPNQMNIARGLVRRAVGLYQRRAASAGVPELPASAYGFTGSELLGGHFDPLTSTSRVASMMAEFSRAGLGRGPTQRLPSGWSHDSQFGRFAVTTARYATAIVGPWRGLTTGGAEPARILDSRARVLTQIGGGYSGTLGMRIGLGSTLLVDTQPGISGHGVSRVRVSGRRRDRSGALGRGVSVTAGASGRGVFIDLHHRFTERGITTRYAIHNRRGGSLDVVMRLPTYGRSSGGSLSDHTPSVAALQAGALITGPIGGSYEATILGLPKGTITRLTKVRGEAGNPMPGPELLVKFKVPRGTTIIRRVIAPKLPS